MNYISNLTYLQLGVSYLTIAIVASFLIALYTEQAEEFGYSGILLGMVWPLTGAFLTGFLTLKVLQLPIKLERKCRKMTEETPNEIR